MHVTEMLVESTAGYDYLSMLDGYSGYNQIFIAEEDVPKIAFRCPGALGTYKWIYIDDIVVKSVSGKYHINHLRQSFERMRKHGWRFLGLLVHKKGIKINQNKTKAIMEVKAP
ncbi:uncharacterized protein LOC127102893 [Lathyrus oleraceus]|uniref:uncharacterized protein LOC127102893 n=1 Tax=Pisum sativum TaxID=3888 RepID=UPI0021D39EBA|nr:uncharacterized protein LOC127102893 [Pisum sativum]